MSDDKPKRDEGSSSIPPELKPFLGQQEWPEAERRDEAEVDAAFAPVEAMVAEWQREADKRDAARGIGNVSAYAAGVVIKEAEKPATEPAEPKVALAIVDVPRKLPAGNPNLPTEEISTRAFSSARSADDEVTQKRDAATTAGTAAPPMTPARAPRTVGGNTERMPVIAVPAEGEKPASPWAKPALSSAPPPTELPSALRPQDAGAHEDDAPGSVTPARTLGDGRGRMTGLVIAGALVLVVVAVAVRVMTRATTDGGVTSPAASSAPATLPAPTATVEPRATSQATTPAPSASTSAAASVQVPAPPSGTTHPSIRAPRPRDVPSNDPYDAPPTPIPVVTSAPSVAPVAPPPPPHNVPPPHPAVAPKPSTSASPFDKPNYD